MHTPDTPESQPDAPESLDFTIERFQPDQFDSPLHEYLGEDPAHLGFVDDSERIVINPRMENIREWYAQEKEPPTMEVAGPRRKLFYNPANFRAAILTAGGLCPGLNDVIRALYMELHYRYQVKEVLGIRYGYMGLAPRVGQPPVVLTPEMVANIHNNGGTILGTSRGPQDPKEMVDFLERERINALFSIGGDGTHRGALALATEIERRNLKISVIGIPKTIDNDISFVERSFGFETAVSIAKQVLSTGHEEARGAYNGVAVVKLMGRYSGFIAAMAAVANGDANFVLVPEIPFDLEGENGFLRHLEQRLENRGHALIVAAEGAGQQLFANEPKMFDASGNVKFHDIGIYLRDRISSHFKGGWHAATVKYIDPSYIIRSAPSNADDSILCIRLGQNAVHAALSGRTKMIVGLWNNTFTHVPMAAVISRKKQLDPKGPEWLSVLESTGQPINMVNR
jgi:6-phosphofructokinase 1